MTFYMNSYYATPQVRTYVVPRAEDLNYNPTVIKKTAKYFHRTTVEKWLVSDLKHLLDKVKHDGDKAKYIGENVITVKQVAKILRHVSNKTKIPIYNLYKNPYRKEVKKKIEKFINDELSK